MSRVRRDPLAGIAPTAPTDQYVPVVRAGDRLFVAGHDPERDGRLAYRGRVGEAVAVRNAGAALRLATANALASVRDAIGSLDGMRCLVLTAFVSSATPDGLDPRLVADSLALLATLLPGGDPPTVWMRPAQGLAAGMPVEVELVLEIAGRPSRVRGRRKGAPAAARAPRRSGARTS
jgi:enamine deaminase RidA (YjgF/YER057c/UK114 family)